MPSLELRSLGSLEILLDGKPLAGFKTRKAQALLIYLAYHAGQSFSREHLQTLLWSESAPKQAAASLRQALANLRGLLPEGMLRVELGFIAFGGESDYTLDVAELTTRPQLYRGPFLQGFDIADAQGWEEWLFTTREQIQSRVLDRLEAQGQAAAAQGHFSAAIESFRQMVRIDSWREDVHRALMRLYDLAGDRAAALAQYERCHAILAQEVGVEPTVE
ncbi:MAG: winged helix-turn-helix domain-containing protein, partial [Chloroflexi bacterium]|nr:winged helix-turn-helix domain-containing protein [Chloroflexota bacterium]